MTLKNSFLLLAILFFTFTTAREARADFFTTDANGQWVKIVPRETPFRIFQKLKTFEAFQQLDATDREYALRDTLLDSMDPNTKLTANQQIGVRHVLSQYYDTMPDAAKEAVQEKVLWMAFIAGDEELTKKMVGKFFSPYPEDRARRLCALVRDSTQMMLYKDQKANFDYFATFDANTLKTLGSLIDSEKQLGNEKCPLGKDDTTPLSLKEMRTKITKLIGDTNPNPPQLTVAAKSKTPCSLADIKKIFEKSVSTIESNGPKSRTRVFLGVNTMNCPVYGLVMRDPQAMYRYYQNTYNEDGIPTLRFKTADDVVKLFEPAGSAPASKPSTAKPTTR